MGPQAPRGIARQRRSANPPCRPPPRSSSSCSLSSKVKCHIRGNPLEGELLLLLLLLLFHCSAPSASELAVASLREACRHRRDRAPSATSREHQRPRGERRRLVHVFACVGHRRLVAPEALVSSAASARHGAARIVACSKSMFRACSLACETSQARQPEPRTCARRQAALPPKGSSTARPPGAGPPIMRHGPRSLHRGAASGGRGAPRRRGLGAGGHRPGPAGVRPGAAPAGRARPAPALAQGSPAGPHPG